jgi:YegS/Rv2252/BmrU family lipid kinase
VPGETLAILNPASRGGRRARWTEIEARLTAAFGAVEVERTRGPGDAARLAREAARAGVRRVLVAGGDGTLSEAVNGLLGAGLGDAVELGLLPFGTGGDFARAVGIPADVERAVEVLAGGKPRPVDVGKLRTIDARGIERTAYFANEVSVGVSAEVVARVKRGPRWLSGRAAFLWATVRAVAAYAPLELRIRVDGVEVFAGPVAVAVAANGGFFGGGMRVAPNARLDDGMLEVVVVRGLPGLRLLPKLPKLYAGTHLSDPAACGFRGREIEVEAIRAAPEFSPGLTTATPLEADGELVGGLPIRIDVLPGALTLLAPSP